MRAQRMESIGTLAGGIAHDLNNILAPIIMSIDFLKTISDHPQAKKILDTIEVSAKRGADIVRQVLSFARGLEGERIEVQPKHLLKDLETIIKDTFPKDIRLQFSVPSETWTILGDPTQMHQILLNLCVNARDAMPNGGSLTVGVENCVLDEQYAAMNIEAKAGRYVIISVDRFGDGNTAGSFRQNLRALLHDQGTQQRHRPGPVDRHGHREEPRRFCQRLQRTRQRHDFQSVPARDGNLFRSAGHRFWGKPTCREETARRFWWSMTRPQFLSSPARHCRHSVTGSLQRRMERTPWPFTFNTRMKSPSYSPI